VKLKNKEEKKMEKLKLQKYWCANPWNKSTCPAYNLKIYNVINHNLQDQVFNLMEAEQFYDDINMLIDDFNYEIDGYKAGFNGRSGGYLCLTNRKYPFKGVEIEDVDPVILDQFKQLAIDIIETVEYMAINYNVVEIERHYTKKIKVMEAKSC
jgi:hypothetical protein